MPYLLNRTLRGVNLVENFDGYSYEVRPDSLFSELIDFLGLSAEEVRRVLKLHPAELEKLKKPDTYVCRYAEQNLREYAEAKKAIDEFMKHQHGFQNPSDVAETGQRIPLEAIVCDLGLVDIN